MAGEFPRPGIFREYQNLCCSRFTGRGYPINLIVPKSMDRSANAGLGKSGMTDILPLLGITHEDISQQPPILQKWFKLPILAGVILVFGGMGIFWRAARGSSPYEQKKTACSLRGRRSVLLHLMAGEAEGVPLNPPI